MLSGGNRNERKNKEDIRDYIDSTNHLVLSFKIFNGEGNLYP